jgi:hypothetical protein
MRQRRAQGRIHHAIRILQDGRSEPNFKHGRRLPAVAHRPQGMRAFKANKTPDWQQVIDSLRQASDRDLVRLRVAIDEILLDPARITEIRSRLGIGLFVQYLSERHNRMNTGRIVELMADRVLIQTTDQKLRWLHYASIQLDPPAARRAPAHLPGGVAFAVGDKVSFEGRDLRHRFGVVKRINRVTATVTGEAGDVRVPYAQLGRVVDL